MGPRPRGRVVNALVTGGGGFLGGAIVRQLLARGDTVRSLSRNTYDDLEARIERLAEAEELGAMRPDLDGNQIMEILGVGPGREVGEAYRHLLELRMDEGPLGEERAREELLAWWARR